MLIWKPSVLTTQGKALLAKAQAGSTTIQITKAQAGSGSYTQGESLVGLTALKAKKQEFAISDKVINSDSTLVLKITMENTELTAGYEVKEFGVFAQDPDKGEILYSIAVAETSDYMPAYNGEIPSVINVSYYLEVANASSVTFASGGALALQSDFLALAKRVTTIEGDALRKYGARRKVSASGSGYESWERLGAAIGLTAGAAIGNGTVQNDFMTGVYPYNAIRPCNLAEDGTVNAYLGDATFDWYGTNGDVMIEVPITYVDRYFTTDTDGVQWEYRWIASGKIGDMKPSRAFVDGDKVYDKIYIPVFNGSLSGDGTKLLSKAGALPLHNKTRAQFRALCRAKNAEGSTIWQLDDVWNMHLLDTLFIIMFAGTNAQGIMGNGRSSMPYNKDQGMALMTKASTNYITVSSTYAANFQVGQAIGIGTDVGSSAVCIDRLVTKIEASTEASDASDIYFDGDAVAVTAGTHCVWSCCQPTGATIQMASANGRCEGQDGRTAVRFLWIEDWYGNGWQFRDGDNIKNWQHYYCNKRSSYADQTYTGDYFAVDYVACMENGYVKRFGYDDEWPEIEICTEVGAGSNTFFCDYYYQAETGEVVLSGGGVDSGTSAGPFSRYCRYGAGASAWSLLARPQCHK